jgi:hypothetical protein
MSQQPGDDYRQAPPDRPAQADSDIGDHLAGETEDTAFDRWLARELRLVRTALARIPSHHTLDTIEDHRKVTK